MNKVFDLESVSVTIIDEGAPIDVSSGLTIDGDFLKVSKESKDEVKVRKGTKGESYSANSITDNIRNLELNYLPSSAPVIILQELRRSKKQFGIFIKSASAPVWTFTASKCIISEEPETTINAKDGFKDYNFKIKAMDSEQVWA